MTLTEKILKVMERVPLPYLPQAASLVDAILTIQHEAHAEAVANGTPPPTLDEMRQAVIDAAIAAGEPWKRIKDRADAGEPTRDPRGEIRTGSPGD